MLASMSFFHSCLKVSTGEVLAVVLTLANEEPISWPIILLHSPKVLVGALLHRSLNWPSLYLCSWLWFGVVPTTTLLVMLS